MSREMRRPPAVSLTHPLALLALVVRLAGAGRGALVLVALAASSGIARAQVTTTGTVSGTVTDSTTGARLGGAIVQLSRLDDPSVGFAATADSAGHFRVAGVPPGRYALGFFHPRLDELSLRAPVRAVDVGDGAAVTADLGVPSPATVYAAVCRNGAPDGALLMGFVRDADSGVAIPMAAVSAVWSALRLDDRGLRNDRRILNVRSDSAGRFVMCGLPGDGYVRVQAATGASSLADESGEVTLAMEAGQTTWRNLTVGRGDAVRIVAGDDSALAVAAGAAVPHFRRGSARLTGRVRRRDGGPQPDAQVLVDGTGVTASTDAQGAFSLDNLPAGTNTVLVRALGYPPSSAVVDLASGRTDTVAVSLGARQPVLEAQNIYGKQTDRSAMEGFLKRSHGGTGHFITPEQLSKHFALDITDYLRTVPGVRIVPDGGFGGTVVLRDCTPSVFVDGAYLADGASDLSMIVSSADVAGIEVYSSPTTTPLEFSRRGCGSVVVWTRGRMR